jgi:two-component system sensor histidine kinase AgrC
MTELVMLLPGVLLFLLAFFNICKEKFTFRETIISGVLTYIITAISFTASLHLRNQAFDADIIGNITCVICLMLVARRKINYFFYSGFCALFTAITVMVCGTALSTLTVIILKLPIGDMRDNPILYILLGVPVFPLSYYVSKYIGNRLYKSYVYLPDNIQKKFFIYGFTLTALAYVLTQINVFVYRVVEDEMMLTSINTILITVIFFVAAITLAAYSRSQQRILEAEHQAKSLEDLTIHNKQLSAAYDELRSYQHDHLSLLYSLMGFVDNKNQNKLREQLLKVIDCTKGTLEKLNASTDRLKYIHIAELSGLLSVKFAHALSKDVELKIDIAEPVNEIPINYMDLCRIVGIMIDNAVEELLSGNYERKLIKFGILLEEGDVLIICTNACKTLPNVENIFTKGYTTKRLSKGLGLYNLKKISEKYDNIFITAYPKDNEFALIITIREVR